MCAVRFLPPTTLELYDFSPALGPKMGLIRVEWNLVAILGSYAGGVGGGWWRLYRQAEGPRRRLVVLFADAQHAGNRSILTGTRKSICPYSMPTQSEMIF